MTLPFSPSTMLAPMEGVTHPAFRSLLAEMGGIGCLCTEFVRITDQKLPKNKLKRHVEKVPGVALSVQVMGREAHKMEEAAGLMADGGADVVDINLGCPSPKAVRGGVGSAMLREPQLLFDVVSSMRRAVPGVLSAKIRAGFDDAQVVLRNARILEDAGVDFLIVHPRRRVDAYQGVADWRIIARLVDELSIPVVGNGDVWYAEDAVRMREETGCAAVMIGRPALRNPFIFRQLADLEAGRSPFSPAGTDVVAYLDRMLEVFGERFERIPVGKVKEVVRWLARAIDDDGETARVLLQETRADALRERFLERVGPLGADALDIQANGHLRLERSGSAKVAVEGGLELSASGVAARA